MNTIKFPVSIASFLRNNSTKVWVNDSVYYHLPEWYKETKDETIFETYSLDNLPPELIEAIEYHREGDS